LDSQRGDGVNGTEPFVEDYRRFVADRASAAPSWLGALREAAITRFAASGFPSTREEDWKYTNVAPLVSMGFRPAFDARGPVHGAVPSLLGERAGWCLVFVNGRFAPDRSRVPELPRGVRVRSLAAALQERGGSAERHLTRHAPFDRNGFTALSTAFLADGAVIELGDRVVVGRPIEVVFASDGREGERVGYPRLLVVCGHETEASLVESYVSLDGAPTLTNAIAEIVLGDRAKLAHVRVVRDGSRGSHVATSAVMQARDSRYASVALALRASFLRHELDVRLAGEGAECSLDGLYVGTGKDVVDNHTTIEHAVARGTSRELYKGVLAGEARAIFNGKVIVRPNAQKSDAQQTNKNLLLSARAEIDTKPELQILADDVKCAHGAAIGQPDPEAVFYLQSRGIGDSAGRRLLTRGFANEVVQRIAPDVTRAALEGAVFERLEEIFVEEA
jgi:Fe-S cluster assembly protein SufD